MKRTRGKSRGVVERTLASFVDAIEHAFYAEEMAKEERAAAKPRSSDKNSGDFAADLYCGPGAALVGDRSSICVALLVVMLSKVPLATLAKRVWLAVLAFTGINFVSRRCS